jgi:hypothetical protein
MGTLIQMDKISIFPYTYFGPISYYNALLLAPCKIDGKEYFVKQTLRSRCDVLGPNGRLTLTVPVNKPNGSKTAMDEITIDYSQPWTSHHLHTLQTAYGSAPYFDHYIYDIKLLLARKYKKLIELNLATLHLVSQWLGVNFNIEPTDQYSSIENQFDYRNSDFGNPYQLPYYQVFFDRFPFTPNLSIIDVIMNEGPMTRKQLI